MAEARRFLSLPRHDPPRQAPASTGSPEAARRLFAMARPIHGTLAETYLRRRAITYLSNLPALRFHPRCFYRGDDSTSRETWPALLAAITNPDGAITGVQRTWLARCGTGKARLATPRRAMGQLLGNGVRFGAARDVLTAGEGIETVLSLRCVLPRLPMIAALSANHLAALALPSGLRRVYIARDNDGAGRRAADTLSARAETSGIEALTFTPTAWPRAGCASIVCPQRRPVDFLPLPGHPAQARGPRTDGIPRDARKSPACRPPLRCGPSAAPRVRFDRPPAI